ncbi:MAG: PhnD/SsuA/transferrin family substrate-binding protein [Desulfobulbaceae bacterium]|nr:PhnD/SsuA/transferrin family substrate-binding protein [Desulfobulbaceae bacterium]
MMIRFCTFWLLLFCLTGVVPSLSAAEMIHDENLSKEKTIRIGVLAKRGRERALKKWQPTALYLNDNIPQFSFEIVPLNFSDVRKAVAGEEIEFLITNSGYYVELETEFGISRIATLKNLLDTTEKNVFGGVIFTRADRNDINEISDLANRTFYAVDRESLGGWQMAWRELHDQGLRPLRDLEVSFLGTHDAVVYGVLEGKADAGSVRTDTLERMAREGVLDLSLLKIINSRAASEDFPFLLSTRLYPEWPFAKMKQTPDQLAERVDIALLGMEPDNLAAQAARIGGWTVPLDYQPIHELMQELYIGPYCKAMGKITLQDSFREHWRVILTFVAVFSLLLLIILIVLRFNRKLAVVRSSLSSQLKKNQLAAKALKNSERNYREIFDNTNDAIFVHDRSFGTILDVNQATCDMYGYTKDEIKALLIEDVTSNEPPYTKNEAINWLKKSSTEGPQTFEWRARKKNGELFWVEVNLKRAEIGGQDRLLAVVRNINQRKAIEEQLEQYRHHLEKLVEDRTKALKKSNLKLRKKENSLAEAQRIAHLGSWDWQVAKDELWWSNEVYHIFGLDPDKSPPPTYKSFLASVHPDDRTRVEKEMNNALLRGMPYSIQHRIILPGNMHRIVHVRGEVYLDSHGKPERMIGTVQNITETKQAEEEKKRLESQLMQAQKMEAIGTLAGGIAHDFNNSLTAIMGFSELARMLPAAQNDVLQDHLAHIHKAGKRARDLVAQILTFSRKNQITTHPVRLSSIVKEALKMLRATLPTTIEFRQNIPAISGQIMADPTQIHHVLMNLCTNAAHAMHNGVGTLSISLTEQKLDHEIPGLLPGPYLKLSISDTGDGIPRKIRDRIFEPFFTTKDKGIGTGMGLSVVHGIVKSYGGDITFTSEEGIGTTFDLYFPALLAVEDPGKKPTSVLPRGRGERLLFVDDEQQILNIARKILDFLGYKVVCLTSSEEALELFRVQPDNFDLVLTDQTMPKMTGTDLAKKMLQIRPDIPIILCTGYSDSLTEETVKKIGMKGLILKPFVVHNLAIEIKKVL